jgi:predicted dehydrogenase
MKTRQLVPAAALSILLALLAPLHAAELRIGMIGLDTSHTVAFTELINNPAHKQHVPGGRVVAAFRGGSPDIESSRSRVDGYTRALETNYHVRIFPTIEALCAEVDVVLLESVDGRPHLEQVRPVIRARKPVFIDKPVAGSLRDAIEIFRLARENKVPVFTSSAYRYYEGMTALLKTDVGRIRGVISYGPSEKEPHHPDFFWYGIHPTEALFTVLGTGCKTVVRTATDDTDVVTGLWSDGRTGTLIGLRTGATPHQVTVFGTKGVAQQKDGGDYAPLVREIMKFFQTGIAPVSERETLEMFAFMEAADESRRRGGAPVGVEETLAIHGWK